MAQGSKIEWTEATWNPVTGCTKISIGCQNCYAERMAKRLQAMGKPQYSCGFQVAVHPEVLGFPKRWKKPRFVFVNSMSDLFHEHVPFDFIESVFDVMSQCRGHTFQVLTKRPHIAGKYADRLAWPKNIWMGVTVEHHETAFRIDALRSLPAKTKFISFEPLLSEIVDFSLRGIDWVIVGGESGPRSRLMKAAWVRGIRDCCTQEGVPFFFKQWGGINKKKAGRRLDGEIWDQMPSHIVQPPGGNGRNDR